MKPEILELWKKFCREDDTKAFERVYYVLFKKLIKFCIYYIGHKEPAEEIVSEIFVKCWNNRKSLADIESPETYLHVAVKNQSIKYNQKFSSIHLVDIDDTDDFLLVDKNDPVKKLETKELHHQLDIAIETLPQQAKLIFRLIKENGLKYKEVAEILDISPRTVQTQLFRAIAKLRVVLHSDYKKKGDFPKDKLLGLIIIFLGKIYFYTL
ncbi:RNA polymerase sigma factor [Rubrolithibacter danxiaensis]|uniref:RNA polymerase sigma factor n=1 Tax=Rubrolithibacter danxiaensis TaxID=3390805 RepID=UPI003BF8BDEB